ncbi:MAG: pyridoxal-phosphate dependent enzyme [Gammaproteobacteria bacterium]|nr:pyridoxal-phosphate dependent enzyme [Pseudomonadales bacterium]MCP5346002.1 pyridoxal-phosphate dependent enzyme [Pseudomonadales bacterium]
MFESLTAAPVLEPVQDPFLDSFQVSLSMLRLDTIHPLVNGNKWFKLRLNLQAAQQAGQQLLLSFGGAYSNHLRALAAAARLHGLQSIGMVRGEIPEPLNPVLAFARAQGMALYPVTRGDYRRKHEPDFLDSLSKRFGNFYLIPEGGSNEEGVAGCESLVGLLPADLATPGQAGDDPATILAVACGTGATLAGLVRGVRRQGLPLRVLGIAILKGAGFLDQAVADWTGTTPHQGNWRIARDYHFGGYARYDQALLDFIDGFRHRTGIPLEPVYTGKLLFGLYDLVRQGEIRPRSRLICLHTGGIYED